MEQLLESVVSPSSSSSSSSLSMSSLGVTIRACETNGLTVKAPEPPEPPEPPPNNNLIQSIMDLSDGFRVWKKFSMMDILLKMDVNVPLSQQQPPANNTQNECESGSPTTSSVKDQQAQQATTAQSGNKKNNFGLCRVCKDKATGIHYGIRSCEGCKGFFKRSLKKHEQYVCYFGNKCNMTPKLRKKCKLCRWKSCLEAGMSFGSMKMGRIPKKDIGRVEEMQDDADDDEANALEIDAKDMPDPRMFSIERMCARDKENLINFLTLRNVLSMCKTHPFSNISDSTELVSTSYFSDIYMNTFNENILFVMSLMRDKCMQLFAELRRPLDPYYHRMKRLRALNLRHILSPSPDNLPPPQVAWALTEKMLKDHVKATAVYIHELPGFSRISVEDTAVILKSRSFAVFGLRVQYLFDEDNEYYLVVDGYQFHRRFMIHGFGTEFTDYIFSYHERLNKLGLTASEIAVLCPLVLSMPGLALIDPEPLAEIHEYYKRVVLYEFSLQKRDRAFMERVNEVLGNIPENEKRCLSCGYDDAPPV